MRTTKKYSFKEALIILAQFVISRFSLWYFRNINSRRITLIRKQGIGDVIFTSGIIKRFSEDHPDTAIKLVVPFPELLISPSDKHYSWKDFPLVWLMYEHYDFKFLKGRDRHIREIIAEHLGMEEENSWPYELNVSDSKHPDFKQEYVDSTPQYIVIQPWAGHWDKNKNWSRTKWEQTLTKIDGNIPVYQIGLEQQPLIEGAKDLRSKTSLSESILLIKHARMFLGINSFGEQAAAAFNVPSVILYGPTNPVYSLNQNQIAIFGENIASISELPQDYKFEPVTSITVDQVISAVKATTVSRSE